MSVHTIRLAGPWEMQASSDAAAERVTLPHEISSGVELRRNFHRPSGLTDDSTVRIVLTSTGSGIELQLNGKHVPSVADTHRHFDVSGQLLSFNTLAVTSGLSDSRSEARQELRQPTTTITAAVLEIHE